MSYVTRQKVQESAAEVAKMIRQLKAQALEQSETYKQAIAELEACRRRTEHSHQFPDFISKFVIDEAIRQIEEDALSIKIKSVSPYSSGSDETAADMPRMTQRMLEGM